MRILGFVPNPGVGPNPSPNGILVGETIGPNETSTFRSILDSNNKPIFGKNCIIYYADDYSQRIGDIVIYGRNTITFANTLVNIDVAIVLSATPYAITGEGRVWSSTIDLSPFSHIALRNLSSFAITARLTIYTGNAGCY
jgi:hypothetical protein